MSKNGYVATGGRTSQGRPEHTRAAAGPSKHEVAYQKVRERILDGRYGPGYRLVLSVLARDLQVSPVPVREAIRRLEAEGLVTFERNVGARVATVDGEAWEHLVETLALLDGYAFAQASRRIPPEAIAEAQRLNDALRARIGSPEDREVMALHRSMHRTIYRYAENDYVIESLDRVWDRIDASRVLVTFYPAKRLASAVDEHDVLLQRLRDREQDLGLLERCARQHNLNAITTIHNQYGT